MRIFFGEEGGRGGRGFRPAFPPIICRDCAIFQIFFNADKMYVPVPTRTLFTQRGGCGTGGDICLLTLFLKETAFVFYEGQGQKDKVPPMVYCSAIFRLYTVLGRQELWDNLRQNDQLGLQAPFEKC